MTNNEQNVRGYASHLYEQLGTAVAQGDADAAMRILDQVDADGHEQAAEIMEKVLARTTLGPALIEPTYETSGDMVVGAIHTCVARIIALARWVDDGNTGRYPETMALIHVGKVAEEAGEALKALYAVLGVNPRKGICGTYAQVDEELLDAALTALTAYEHLHGYQGYSLAALFTHAQAIHERAGLSNPTDPRS